MQVDRNEEMRFLLVRKSIVRTVVSKGKPDLVRITNKESFVVSTEHCQIVRENSIIVRLREQVCR